jgi:hypothetical protein
MATRLVFPSEEALRLALTGELIPTEVQAGTARVRRDEDGSITVEPDEKLTKAQLGELGKAGVKVARGGKGQSPAARGSGATKDTERGKGKDGLSPVLCWAEIVPPSRVTEHEIHTAMVLFALPEADRLLPLAGELLRLGCDRQDFCYMPDEVKQGDGVAALLKAVKPPYYTLARALDRPGGMRAFAPFPPGQERVWIELGFHHPLASSVHSPGGGLLLIADDSWRALPAAEWTSLYKVIDVQLRTKAEAAQHEQVDPTRVQRLQVELQLRRLARDASPTLWVLPEDGVEVVDRLIQQLPEREIARLLFAVGGDPERPVVLLRAREGRGKPPVLELPLSAVAHAPWLDIGNLFLPADAILEPPLRRESLRSLLSPDPELVTWLTPVEEDPKAFGVERIADDAFSPLEDWVEYVVHSRAAELEPWVRAVTFEFDAFESVGVEWSERPAAPPPEERKPKERKKRRERAVEEPTEAAEEYEVYEVTDAEPEQEPDLQELPTFELSPGTKDEQALAELEQRFLESEEPAEAPERNEAWLEMARLNTKLGRQRDAGLCWTRALWEADGDRARVVAQHWSVAEAILLGDKSGGGDKLVDRLLGDEQATSQQARAMVAQLVRAVAGAKPQLPGPDRLYQLKGWLDSNDEGLDVRSLWLGHLALSRMAGGDALQLTRTRDRILTRLFRGISVEHDVPTFLRFCGGGAGADTTVVQQLAGQLEELHRRYHKTKRKRSAVEAPEKLTGAYVNMLFAYGFARLGQADRARDLRQTAADALPEGDPIHSFLRQALGARVEHALEVLPAETPLPSEISGQLNALERFVRYKVDRLRQASFILEPHEHLDPVLAFQQAKSDPRGEEFAPMRGMTDHQELSNAVAEVMRKALATGTSIEDRARLFDGVMDFFPMLPESESVPHLRTLIDSVEEVALAPRCMLLEEALMLSGLFGRGDMVQELVGRLQAMIGALGGEHIPEVARTLGQCLRSMRRVGLTDEAGDLLSQVGAAITGAGTPVLVARLQVASGLADLGRTEEARTMLQEGTKALKDKSLLLVDRLEITRAMSGTASHLSLEQAVAELRELAGQLPMITDSFNTNSHFSLSVIQFMESLILGYASEQLALGQLGRRWLDEDEYLVRRRIHRDLGAHTQEQR